MHNLFNVTNVFNFRCKMSSLHNKIQLNCGRSQNRFLSAKTHAPTKWFETLIFSHSDPNVYVNKKGNFSGEKAISIVPMHWNDNNNWIDVKCVHENGMWFVKLTMQSHFKHTNFLRNIHFFPRYCTVHNVHNTRDIQRLVQRTRFQTY